METVAHSRSSSDMPPMFAVDDVANVVFMDAEPFRERSR